MLGTGKSTCATQLCPLNRNLCACVRRGDFFISFGIKMHNSFSFFFRTLMRAMTCGKEGNQTIMREMFSPPLAPRRNMPWVVGKFTPRLCPPLEYHLELPSQRHAGATQAPPSRHSGASQAPRRRHSGDAHATQAPLRRRSGASQAPLRRHSGAAQAPYRRHTGATQAQ